MQPDLVGFAEAQKRLRESFGREITFWTPSETVWDPALGSGAFDPETGRPYDPLTQPVASGETAAVLIGRTIGRVLRREGAEEGDALGFHDAGTEVVSVDPDEFHASASAATAFEIDGDRYEIRSTTNSGNGADWRILVYGDREGDR